MEDILKEQDMLVHFYKKNPAIRTCVVLEIENGREPYVTSLTACCVNGGVSAPPALAADGRLYTSFRTSAAERGFVDITRCAAGHSNISTGKIDRPILCGGPEGVSEVIGRRCPFEVTSDETVTPSGGGYLLFGIRCDETPGAIDVRDGSGFRVQPAFLPRASDLQPTGNGLAISGKYVLFTKFSTVVCFRGKSFKTIGS